MGKSTISMAIFNSLMLVYQRVRFEEGESSDDSRTTFQQTRPLMDDYEVR